MTDIVAIVVAAGIGSRMRGDRPKQYLKIGPRTMLQTCVSRIAKASVFKKIFVCVSPEDPYVDAVDLKPAIVLRCGGKTREETVFNALKAIKDDVNERTLVAVHDAARALIEPDDIKRLVDAVCDRDFSASGAVLAIPVSDTVKRIDKKGVLSEDIDREGLVRIATPQVFFYKDLLEVLPDQLTATDESGAMRSHGKKVLVIPSSPYNFKLTTPNDLEFANQLMRETPMTLRIGTGFDSHRLVSGRALVLGGIEIPYEKGLDGHSDADVLIHAIIDALLGAAHMGNIGLLYPNSDPRYKDVDSKVLLADTVSRLGETGFEIVNIDTVLIAEAPKLNPYLDSMTEVLSKVLGISKDLISIKPKTNEKLGFEGRKEGISAQAVCLLNKM